MPIKEPTRKTATKRVVIDGFIGGLHNTDIFTKTAILETETPSAVNVEFWPVGTVSKRHGKQSLHPLNGPVQNTAIILTTQWWAPTGTSYILAFTCASGTASADLWTFTASAGDGFFTSILSASENQGLSGQVPWAPELGSSITFAAFAGSAIFCDGLDPTYAFDGTTAGQLSQAPTAARYITVFRNTMFVAGALDGSGARESSTVRWSNPGDPTVWPVENYIDLDPDDGDEITGMWIIGNELVVFKGAKIYSIAYVGGQFQYYAELRVDGTGCASYDSLITLGAYCYFYGSDAFYRFDGRNLESISDKIQGLVLNINPSYRDRVYSNTDLTKSQLFFLVHYLDATKHNYCFVYDIDRENWTMITMDAACIGVYSNIEDLTWNDLIESWDSYSIAWGDRVFLSNSDQLITGSYDGYLYLHGTIGIDTDNGAAFKGSWQSKWLDFDEADYNKRILRVTLLLDKQSSGCLNVGTKKDWDDSTYVNTYSVCMTGTELSNVVERRIDFTLYCRAFQLEAWTEEANTPFSIHKVLVEYVPKGRTKI